MTIEIIQHTYIGSKVRTTCRITSKLKINKQFFVYKKVNIQYSSYFIQFLVDIHSKMSNKNHLYPYYWLNVIALVVFFKALTFINHTNFKLEN